jgi:sugar O-acyltransferase (sialic acid O-acetyltransferase NeuD family)
MPDLRFQVIICGAGGHGRVVADIIEDVGSYSIAGFIDDDPALQGHCVGGYPVLGGRGDLPRLRERGMVRCAMGIGDNATRRELASMITAMGWELITVIHPSAQISPRATIGGGSVIEACAVVKAGCLVGRLAIINSCASIGHDVILGEAIHISPGASIAGSVRIGDGTHIGMGASVIPGIKIGQNVVVGANAAVVRDLPDNVVAAGVPARTIRHNG